LLLARDFSRDARAEQNIHPPLLKNNPLSKTKTCIEGFTNANSVFRKTALQARPELACKVKKVPLGLAEETTKLMNADEKH
jgi:hypothetical protein